MGGCVSLFAISWKAPKIESFSLMFDRMQAWSLLLPTAEERATALAALLQRGDGDHGSSGRRFMADLLVTCLMAEAKDADIEDGHAGACDLPPPVGFSRG